MNKIFRVGLTLGLALAGSSAMAAGAGTGIEAGFTDVGTDLQTLLNGAGGFIVIVLSIALAAIMLAIGVAQWFLVVSLVQWLPFLLELCALGFAVKPAALSAFAFATGHGID